MVIKIKKHTKKEKGMCVSNKLPVGLKDGGTI